VKPFKKLRNVVGHAKRDGMSDVVEFDREPEVLGRLPIDLDFVEKAQCGEEMFRIIIRSVLDGEVIDDEGKEGRSGGMVEQAGNVIALGVPMGGEVSDETTLGKVTSLGESIHAQINLKQYGAIDDILVERILVHDTVRNVSGGYADIFGAFQRCPEVVVFDVGKENVAGAMIEGAVTRGRVKECFNHFHIRSPGRDLPRIVNAIAASGTADAVGGRIVGGEFLLRLWVVIRCVATAIDGLCVGPNGANRLGVDQATNFLPLGGEPLGCIGTGFGSFVGQWVAIGVEVERGQGEARKRRVIAEARRRTTLAGRGCASDQQRGGFGVPTKEGRM